jgi:hypothetical protein
MCLGELFPFCDQSLSSRRPPSRAPISKPIWVEKAKEMVADVWLYAHLEVRSSSSRGDDELALAESKWLLEGEDSASEVDGSSQQQQAEELVSASESEAE